MIPIPPNPNGTYKLIKYCRACKVRFVTNKGESNKNYCDSCVKRFEKEQKSKKD